MRIVSAGLMVLALLSDCGTEDDQEPEATPTSCSPTIDETSATVTETPEAEGFRRRRP